MPMYRELPDSTVSPATRQAAQTALAHGCRLLGMALLPEVRWCLPVTDPAEAKRASSLSLPGYRASLVDFLGAMDGFHYCVWVRADMGSKETAMTVLHELGHLHYRLERTPALGRSTAQRAAEEADVEAFAQQAVKALGL